MHVQLIRGFVSTNDPLQLLLREFIRYHFFSHRRALIFHFEDFFSHVKIRRASGGVLWMM